MIYIESDISDLLDKSGDYGINPVLAQFYTYHSSVKIPEHLLDFIFNHWHEVDSDSSGDLARDYSFLRHLFT